MQTQSLKDTNGRAEEIAKNRALLGRFVTRDKSTTHGENSLFGVTVFIARNFFAPPYSCHSGKFCF